MRKFYTSAILLLVAAFALSVLLIPEDSPYLRKIEVAGWVAGCLAFLLSVLALFRWKSRSERVSTPTQVTEAENMVRLSLSRYLQDALRLRGLTEEDALPVRWRQYSGIEKGKRSASQIDLEVRSSAPASEVGRIFAAADKKRLLIVSKPGFGKSVLCLFLAKGLTDPTEDLVPVLLPATSWKSSYTSLSEWVSSWLNTAFPALHNQEAYGGTPANSIAASPKIVPIIDGLDEVHPLQQTEILRAVSAYGKFVIACRTDALKSVHKTGKIFKTAITVELLGPTVDQGRAYLEERDPTWQTRESAAELLRSNELRDVIQRPLTLYLLEKVWSQQPRETGLLNRAGKDLENYLWSRYLPSVLADAIASYSTSRTKRLLLDPQAVTRQWNKKAEDWARYIVTDLSDNAGEFKWWKVANKSDHALHDVLIRLVAGGLASVTYVATAKTMGEHPTPRSAGTVALLTFIGLTLVAKARIARTSVLEDDPSVDSIAPIAYGAGIALAAYSIPRDGVAVGVLTGLVVCISLVILAVSRKSVTAIGQGGFETPLRSIRRSRVHALAGFTGIFCAAFLVWLPLPLSVLDRSFGAAIAAWTVAGWFLLESIWGKYLKFCLAVRLTGHAPARLTAFLENLRELGVLYSIGPVYKLRHREIRDALATPAHDDSSQIKTATT